LKYGIKRLLKISTFAPIVLFVYNRPWHTQQTIEALQANILASESELIIYSDAAKSMDAEKNVKEVREYIHNITGFKSVEIVEAKCNKGLADSIIEGVTTVVNRFGKVIVLEDDIVTGKYFLQYMNDGLNKFIDTKEVWVVNGYFYPTKKKKNRDACFLYPFMVCWGWATWDNRWKDFKKNPGELISSLSYKDIRHINLDGACPDFWLQVLGNYNGLINTWAIFWLITIIQNAGLCLAPYQSLVKNIGLDNSGEHCGEDKKLAFLGNIDQEITYFPDQVKPNMKEYGFVRRISRERFRKMRVGLFLKRRINLVYQIFRKFGRFKSIDLY
jgi:hypothetical protein